MLYTKSTELNLEKHKIREIEYLLYVGEIGSAKIQLDTFKNYKPLINHLDHPIENPNIEIIFPDTELCRYCQEPLELSECFIPDACRHFFHKHCIESYTKWKVNLLDLKYPEAEYEYVFNEVDMMNISVEIGKLYNEQVFERMMKSGVIDKFVECSTCKNKFESTGKREEYPRCKKQECDRCKKKAGKRKSKCPMCGNKFPKSNKIKV